MYSNKLFNFFFTYSSMTLSSTRIKHDNTMRVT